MASPNIPATAKVVNPDGLMSQEWLGYFTSRQGRNQKPWEPVLVNLGGGVAVVSGYWTLSERLFSFSIRITPSTTTSSVLASTYLDLPFSSLADGAALAFNTSTKTLLGAALIEAGTSRAYLPTWTTLAAPVSVSGSVQIRTQNG